MILGEYHYCYENCFENCGKIPCKEPTFTSMVMDHVINSKSPGYFESYMNTFTHFERAVFNKELSQSEKEEFWNSVVFYNYLQKAMKSPGMRPGSKLYPDSFDAFIEVIECYQPDLIIVWGKRLFSNLPEGNGKKGIPLNINGTLYEQSRIYYLSNGKEIKVFGVNHPSHAFEREYWHQILSSALAQ
jgi:hypothetical protein